MSESLGKIESAVSYVHFIAIGRIQVGRVLGAMKSSQLRLHVSRGHYKWNSHRVRLELQCARAAGDLRVRSWLFEVPIMQMRVQEISGGKVIVLFT
jgi:hypothetical protein